MTQSSSSKARRGAIGARIGIGGRIKAALGHHSHTFQDSLKRFIKDPLQTLLTSLVIAIALSLPASLFLVVENAQQFENSFDSFSKITVYIDASASNKKIAIIRSQLQLMPEVAALVYISPEQAMQEFTQSSGFGGALSHLDSNPLPPVFVIDPEVSEPIMTDQVQQLLAKISQIDSVEDVQMDMLFGKCIYDNKYEYKRIPNVCHRPRRILARVGARCVCVPCARLNASFGMCVSR